MDKELLADSKYVVAVSGGVDSVVLLHMLVNNGYKNLVVAHVNHGIRQDSHKDQELVKDLTKNYTLDFETTNLKLGPDTSENTARKARYGFLEEIKNRHGATAIITAHHQDDLIETAFINIIRGTGRSGLSSLRSGGELIRPLLNISKSQILKYANLNNLKWQEDSTNQDKTYLRNKIRIDVVPRMTQLQRKLIIDIIDKTAALNSAIDKELNYVLKQGLHKDNLVLSRAWFCKLPHDLSTEIARLLLIRAGCNEINKDSIERLVIGIKTLPSGKTIQLSGVDAMFTKRSARIKKHSQTDNKPV